MKKFVDSCYMWMQAYLVARSCSEDIMYLNCDTRNMNDEQLTRYEEIVGTDLKSGVFGDYILFRFKSGYRYGFCRRLLKCNYFGLP